MKDLPLCDGQGRVCALVSFVFVIDRDQSGPTASMVFCPECEKLTIGAVTKDPVSSTYWVTVPSHTRRRRVVTLEPRKEFL